MTQCLRAKNHLELFPTQRLSFKRSLWKSQPYFWSFHYLARLCIYSLHPSRCHLCLHPLLGPCFSWILQCLSKSLKGKTRQAGLWGENQSLIKDLWICETQVKKQHLRHTSLTTFMKILGIGIWDPPLFGIGVDLQAKAIRSKTSKKAPEAVQVTPCIKESGCNITMESGGSLVAMRCQTFGFVF